MLRVMAREASNEKQSLCVVYRHNMLAVNNDYRVMVWSRKIHRQYTSQKGFTGQNGRAVAGVVAAVHRRNRIRARTGRPPRTEWEVDAEMVPSGR